MVNISGVHSSGNKCTCDEGGKVHICIIQNIQVVLYTLYWYCI